MEKKYWYINCILIISCIIFILLAIVVFNKKDTAKEKETVQSNEKNVSNEETQIEQIQERDTGAGMSDEADAATQTEPIQELDTESQPKEDASEIVTESFFYTELTDEIKARITGISYPDTDAPLQITYEDLAYVHVLHYDFGGQIQQGELICNRAIAQDLVEIFTELYENQYPIEKICLIDVYGGDDEASMQDNNTSCFNYRTVSGKANLSNHSYGLAIDINPRYNPYVRTKDGKLLVSPDNGVDYVDRSMEFLYKIDEKDLCYKLFIEHGFTWGGAWNSVKDYQHFEK